MIQIDMDMPEYCGVNECPLCTLGWRDKNRYTEWCHRPNGNGFVMVGYNGEENKIPDDCPLKEVKSGHWDIEISDDGHQATYRCSECGHRFKWIYNPYFPPVFNYCQKCGARMDG